MAIDSDLTLSWPVDINQFPITQTFGENPDSYAKFNLAGHNGIDIGCPLHTPVLSCFPGWISEFGYDKNGYGNYVKIKDAQGITMLYAHLESLAKWLRIGVFVIRGGQIGYSNNTGNSTGPHLHLTLKIPGMGVSGFLGAVDPMPYFEAIQSNSVNRLSTAIDYDNIVGLPAIPENIIVGDEVELNEKVINYRSSPGVPIDNSNLLGSINNNVGKFKVTEINGAWVKFNMDIWVYGGYVKKVNNE